jgi:hypothetical protein
MLQSSFQTRTKVLKKSIVTKQSPKVRTNLHDKCTDSVKLKVQGEIPHERLMKESIQTEHKLRVGNSVNKNSDEQGLQQLFQKGIKRTKSSHKLRTKWSELDNSRVTNRKIPFKMKRKEIRASESKVSFKMKQGLPLPKAKQIPFKMKRLVTVKSRKPNVRMKDISNQNNFGKLRWKFKNGIHNPKTMCQRLKDY